MFCITILLLANEWRFWKIHVPTVAKNSAKAETKIAFSWLSLRMTWIQKEGRLLQGFHPGKGWCYRRYSNKKVVRKIEEKEFLIVKQVLLTAPMEMYGEQCGENACSYTATIRRGWVMKNFMQTEEAFGITPSNICLILYMYHSKVKFNNCFSYYSFKIFPT